MLLITIIVEHKLNREVAKLCECFTEMRRRKKYHILTHLLFLKLHVTQKIIYKPTIVEILTSPFKFLIKKKHHPSK